MSKLTFKLFLVLLPLAVLLLLFGYAYYQARQMLTKDHILQSTQLSASLGAAELRHYLEDRYLEFEKLSETMAQCPRRELALTDLSADALSFTHGFSALVITDLSGQIKHFTLSANKSNRYILRQSVTGLALLPADKQAALDAAFKEWQAAYPENIRMEKQILDQIHQLSQRGEENSQQTRRLNDGLIKLREQQYLPKHVVSLAATATVAQLGLIYDRETYLFSRPLVNCDKKQVGYYSAVLDRTLIEDHLFKMERNLSDHGLQRVDVFVTHSDDLHPLTDVHYLPITQLATQGWNRSTEPVLRRDLNGILINLPIDVNIKAHQAFWPQRPEQHPIATLAVFVSMEEITSANWILLREVLIYLVLALGMFVLLTLYLSHFISAPIIELRRRISVLSRTGRARTNFAPRDDEIGDLFTAFSDMAFNIKTKESQLVELTRQDPLTHIINRRALVQHAEKFQQLGVSCCLCMLDLDHFKTINDNLGHATGDAVLKDFCALVSDEIRTSDIFGRIGGEEFALILPQTELQDAARLAERIRKRVESQLIAFNNTIGQESRRVTVSIGVASWYSGEFDKALSKADKLLYQAKDKGRNQVAVEPE
ncbi:GGDEF domain-containing protein [Vibrio sp. CAU 1672]|uniref:GGDEF domain-containing protein n=1 Tax=Vibrio sp. CAU 1672 TaxID=3032594 RepID=UPI0023DC4ADC|nr:GGDEF domain-containing protein [Vibrio sp. CAU 1672]MDF2153074.1 GGDEF domain-containing protein [Vibrio sp. CAU 1672]